MPAAPSMRSVAMWEFQPGAPDGRETGEAHDDFLPQGNSPKREASRTSLLLCVAVPSASSSPSRRRRPLRGALDRGTCLYAPQITRLSSPTPPALPPLFRQATRAQDQPIETGGWVHWATAPRAPELRWPRSMPASGLRRLRRHPPRA